MITITYKTKLLDKKPYPTMDSEYYISWIKQNWISLGLGETGIILSKCLILNNQTFYVPFLDIDGNGDNRESKIHSAIQNAKITYRILSKLGIVDHFYFIATGKTGFRAISHLLLSKNEYLAFVEWVRHEMPHIDIQPTERMDEPDILLCNNQGEVNQWTSTGGSSTIIDPSLFLSDDFDSIQYRSLTDQHPDIDAWIQFLEHFFQKLHIPNKTLFPQFYSQLNSHQYSTREKGYNMFDIHRLQNHTPNLSLEIIHQMLLEKGIENRIERRGNQYAISFQGIPCPSCQESKANARACPPNFTLYCFNTDCQAYTGLPFYKWSGLSHHMASSKQNVPNPLLQKPPNSLLSLQEAELEIRKQIQNQHSTVICATPGSGKTHIALEELLELSRSKTIIYSCYNKSLKEEAYQKATSMNHSNVHLEKLHARDEVCHHPEELKSIQQNGFSPHRHLCSTCPVKPKCVYYNERKQFPKGMYFTTHQMLSHLDFGDSTPDVIVLDENIQKGFFAKETCQLPHFYPLYQIVQDQENQEVLNTILSITQELIKQSAQHNQHTSILNGRKVTSDMKHEDTLIGLIACHFNETQAETLNRIKELLKEIDQHPYQQLLQKNINYNTVEWIRGLTVHNQFSSVLVRKDGSTEFQRKYIAKFLHSNAVIKVLDAYGSKEIAQSLFHRIFHESRIDVAWNAQITHIQQHVSRQNLQFRKPKYFKKLLKECFDHVTGKNILVVSYKKCINTIQKLLKEMYPNLNYEFYHFFGPRGINTFEHCDSILVLGLPYQNINSAYHDAHILFSNPEQTELIQLYNEYIMESELSQILHRIRPVRNTDREIILAADRYPSSLPKPQQTITRSNDKMTKSIAEAHLLPQINLFGFCNQDIMFLSGVHQKQKESVFRGFWKRLLERCNQLTEGEFNNRHSPSEENDFCINEDDISSYIVEFNFDKRVILSLIYYYTKNYPFEDNNFFKKNILKHSKQLANYMNLNKNNHSTITISNTNACRELESTLLERFPHFERFQLRLKHYGNQLISGIGIKSKVLQFYRGLCEIGALDDIDLNSYNTLEPAKNPIPKIPDEYRIVFFHKNDHSVFTFQHRDEIESYDLSLSDELPRSLTEWLQNSEIEILTNSAKQLYKLFHRFEIESNSLRVHDLLLNEKILQNSSQPQSSMEHLICNYCSIDTFEAYKDLYLLLQIHQQQKKQINDQNMQKIIKLEQQVNPIISKMEETGIGIDRKTLEYKINNHSVEDGYDIRILQRIQDSIDTDGRYRDSILQMTTTGRKSSSLHTLPNDPYYRSIFIPKQNHRFILADYRTFEARIFVGLSKDENGLRLLKENKDIYQECALLNSPFITDINEIDDELRNQYKTILLMLINGAGVYGIAQKIGCTEKVAKQKVQNCYCVLPRLQEWKWELLEKARSNGWIQTPMGRRRNIQDTMMDTQILNFLIQGTGADGFKQALVNIQQQLSFRNSTIVHTQHDEIIVESPEKNMDEVKKIVQNGMQNAFVEVFPEVPFEVDLRVAESWNGSVDHSESRLIQM